MLTAHALATSAVPHITLVRHPFKICNYWIFLVFVDMINFWEIIWVRNKSDGH